MTFQVRTETRPTTGGLDGTIYVLTAPGGAARAAVWPANGFNCFSWQIVCAGTTWDLLYADPQFFHGGKPTRTGIPILFPFPNRIRAGRLTWDGKSYQLPLNDPAGKNAIHGFACHAPWRVIAQGVEADAAWVTGEFHGALDAPEARPLWPADALLRVTYRLTATALRIEAQVQNPDQVSLPFGLGYHPYLHVPTVAGESAEHFEVKSSAGQFWQLEESLPTGKLLPVDEAHDLRTPRPFTTLAVDDVWHIGRAASAAGASEASRLTQRAGLLRGGTELVRLATSPEFRELVIFTPPHRQAVCLEPYTCTTDAVNLQARGVDAGWRVLRPGESWRAIVELAFAEPTEFATR